MIPAEADFIKVAAGMFATHIVKDSLLGPLDQRSEGLCGVVVYRSPGVLLAQMVDRRVGGISLADALVRGELIAHQVSLWADPGVDQRGQPTDLVVWNLRGSN